MPGKSTKISGMRIGSSRVITEEEEEEEACAGGGKIKLKNKLLMLLGSLCLLNRFGQYKL